MQHSYIICFDITNDKIRRRVVKLLLAKAVRVQKSVFEAILTDKHFIELKNKLDKLVNCEKDSIRYYELCKNCAANVAITGIGSYVESEEIIIV